MADTFTQLYIQFVFSTKRRVPMIHESIRERLEKVMCGIISKHKCKPLAIYCNPDHVHILVRMSPDISPSKLMEQVKSGSSLFVNKEQLLPDKFYWQKGFGAFSYSESAVKNVIQYILNQPIHHKKKAFQEEYLGLLNEYEVEYNENYVFD